MADIKEIGINDPALADAQRRIAEHNPGLDLAKGIAADRLRVIEVHENGARLATFACGRLAKDILRVYAVHADSQRGDVVKGAMQPLEDWAEGQGAKQIVIDTQRPGMLAKLARSRRLLVSWQIGG